VISLIPKKEKTYSIFRD